MRLSGGCARVVGFSSSPPLPMQNSCNVCSLTCLLVVVGAVNWGLVGLGGFLGGDWNVVHMILGAWPKLEWLVYVLVGVAGVMQIFASKCPCRTK